MSHKYPQEEKEFFIEYVPGHSHKEILEEFNARFPEQITLSQVKGYIENHKLNTGRNGQYQKGNVPANKGTKGLYNVGGNKTSFRKGESPHNHKPVGTVSVRHNNNRGHKYVYVKVAEPNKWRMLHVVTWEKHNGSVPNGMNIIFLDGNTLNTDIDNLAIINRGENATINKFGLRANDKDLTQIGISTAKLMQKISSRKGKNNG